MTSKTISYSSWKEWDMCPYRHKLMKIDGIRLFAGSEYSAFGSAMHYVIEKQLEQYMFDKKNGRNKRGLDRF